MMFTPIRQDLSYHKFADSRTLLGVPNAWNVLTNAAFLVVALYGMYLGSAKLSYYCIMVGTLLVAFGSAYYHWRPDNDSLVWDRLPMAVAFMALVAYVTNEKWLAPLMAFGILSVLYWHFTDDLRLYAVTQFGAVIVVLLADWERLWPVATLYTIAKILEAADHKLTTITATGGHPWKHVAAAGAMLLYIWIEHGFV